MPKSQKQLWFRAKRYGYGWYPVTWQGWTVLAVYLCVLIGAACLFGHRLETDLNTLVIWLAVWGLSTVMLILICAQYGERLGWHWGNSDTDYE